MTTGDRIGIATLIATAFGAVAAWLVVPGVMSPHQASDNKHPTLSSDRGGDPTRESVNEATARGTPKVSDQYDVKLPTQYNLEIEYCRRNGLYFLGGGTGVTCSISVTNTGESMGHPTLLCGNVNGTDMASLVGSDGKAYSAIRCYFGGKESDDSNTFNVSPHVMYRIEIHYSDIATYVDTAALVNFHLDDATRRNYSGGHDEVRFTNIPILR